MKNLNELPEILEDSRSNGLLRNQSVRCVPTCEKKRIPGVQIVGPIYNTESIANEMAGSART